MKILAIDDSKVIHRFVKKSLEPHGITVESAFDGREGLDKLGDGNGFDLVLLDWEMPVLNGPDTLARIVERQLTVPVAMMTTINDQDKIATMLESGATDYILKPFTEDILEDKVRSIVEGGGFEI